METQTILTLVGICVTLLGIIAYHRLARSRNREERRIQAGKDLIASFDATKTTINDYNGYFYSLVNILRNHAENQKTAACEFKRHLGFVERYRFNKAWHKYHGDNAEILNLTHCKAGDVQRILLSQIEEILKFTR
jgi:hypothetical protein